MVDPASWTRPVWQTDVDGYLVGETVADLSPLDWEQGREVWMIPAGCVDKRPPAGRDGQRLRWDNARWRFEPIPAPKPEAEAVVEAAPQDAASKLAAFLAGNPDVRALIGLGAEG